MLRNRKLAAQSGGGVLVSASGDQARRGDTVVPPSVDEEVDSVTFAVPDSWQEGQLVPIDLSEGTAYVLVQPGSQPGQQVTVTIGDEHTESNPAVAKPVAAASEEANLNRMSSQGEGESRPGAWDPSRGPPPEATTWSGRGARKERERAKESSRAAGRGRGSGAANDGGENFLPSRYTKSPRGGSPSRGGGAAYGGGSAFENRSAALEDLHAKLDDLTKTTDGLKKQNEISNEVFQKECDQYEEHRKTDYARLVQESLELSRAVKSPLYAGPNHPGDDEDWLQSEDPPRQAGRSPSPEGAEFLRGFQTIQESQSRSQTPRLHPISQQTAMGGIHKPRLDYNPYYRIWTYNPRFYSLARHPQAP